MQPLILAASSHVSPMPDSFARSLLNAVAAGVYLVDTTGTIVFANVALCQITGFGEDELTGRPCTVLGCSACATSRLNARENTCCDLFHRDTAVTRRCRFRHKNGHPVPVEKTASVLVFPDGKVYGVECVRDISHVVEQEDRLTELSYLLDTDNGFAGFVGNSQVMRRFYHLLQQAARGDAPVLLLGPSGSGKELAAAAIHNLSARRGNPYVAVNCAAFNESVLESELFGHVRGAFTGAVRDRQGRFGAASLGTLFLDEIGDMPLSIQVKLLRFLENGRYEAVGDNAPRYADVRLISATHRPLWNMVGSGHFREDFFFRINVFPVEVPALAAHPEDIPLLAEHFLRSAARRQERPTPRISSVALELLQSHTWPGNVRELRNAVEYAVMLGGDTITVEHLPPQLLAPPPARMNSAQPAAPLPARDAARRPSDAEISAAIGECGGNVAEAARRLGIHRTTIYARQRKNN